MQHVLHVPDMCLLAHEFARKVTAPAGEFLESLSDMRLRLWTEGGKGKQGDEALDTFIHRNPLPADERQR